MLKYKTLVLGEMAANCYLVWEESDKKAFIIDPGDDSEFIVEEVDRLGLVPIMVLVTHGHFDHVMAALDVKLIFNINFGASELDKFLINRQAETAKYFLKRNFVVPNLVSIDVDLNELENIYLGDEKLEIIKSPGHTPGSVCFYSESSHVLISGDTIFKEGVGRTDFKYSSLTDLTKSLNLILNLPNDTLILPGHGEETTIAELKKLG
jgi:glyoxylase-like metal-dependent hydrolase (beta-lactamase superfamily II)